MLGLILLLALAVRMRGISEKSFWFDEACSWQISQFRSLEIFDAVSRDAHPPLFYFILKAWQFCWGTSFVSARWFGVLAGIATVLSGFWFAKTVIRSEHNYVGSRFLLAESFPWVFAVVLALNPLQIELSQQCRPYQLGMTLTFLAAGFCLRALETPSHRSNWIGFGFCCLILSMIHYFGLVTVLALFLAGLIEVAICFWRAEDVSANRQRLMGLIVTAGILQLCWGPWIVVFLSQTERLREQIWLPALGFMHLLRVGVRFVAGENRFSSVWGVGVGVLGAKVLIQVVRRCGRAGRIMAVCFGLPVIVAVGVSLLVRNLLEVRYLIFAQGMFLAALCCCICSWPAGWRRVGNAVLIVTSLGLCWNDMKMQDWHASHSGLRQAMDYVNQHRQAGEPVILSTPFIFPTARTLLTDSHQIFVEYRGDHRDDVLAGPVLRKSDYEKTAELLASFSGRFWVVDAVSAKTPLIPPLPPEGAVTVGEQMFVESFGIPMQLLLRCYERSPDGDKIR